LAIAIKKWFLGPSFLARIIHEILKRLEIKTGFHGWKYTLLFQHNHLLLLYQYDKPLFKKLMDKKFSLTRKAFSFMENIITHCMGEIIFLKKLTLN